MLNKKDMCGGLRLSLSLIFALNLISVQTFAHDPIFGMGPHVLYKDGLEVAVEFEFEKAGGEKEQAVAVELTYGITGDWAAGIDIPYKFKQDASGSSAGTGDLVFFTKYRFWRKDSLALQQSAAVMLKVITDTAVGNKTPALNKGTTDTIVGLAYGYEGRKWYHWESIRYRSNGMNKTGVDRGDKILLDFVGGIRPTATGYLEADTVWLLELNGEFGQRSKLNGVALANTGGSEWFISPGIFWTKRNFAIKAGIQIPIVSNLNGNQDKSDHRVKVAFEWHL